MHGKSLDASTLRADNGTICFGMGRVFCSFNATTGNYSPKYTKNARIKTNNKEQQRTKEKQKPLISQGLTDNIGQYRTPLLSGWRDSNPRPLRPERSTLPTEPHPEIFSLSCPWADLNCRPLVSETTALSTELQGLAVPKIIISASFLNFFWLRSQAHRRQDLHS